MKAKNTKFNFLRKGWHLLGLFIPVAVFLDVFNGTYNLYHATRVIIVICLGVSLVGLVILEILRFRYEGFSRFFWMILGPLMKESEREYMNATIPYFLANFIVILLFPAELAVLSLAFLVIGDPIAAYIGSNYGKHRLYNGKSWEGIFAFIMSASAFGFILLWIFSIYQPGTHYSLFYGDGSLNFAAIAILLVGAVSAGITEFFSGTSWKGFLDDNLLIPIVSAFVMGMLMILILGISSQEIFFDLKELFLTTEEFCKIAKSC